MFLLCCACKKDFCGGSTVLHDCNCMSPPAICPSCIASEKPTFTCSWCATSDISKQSVFSLVNPEDYLRLQQWSSTLREVLVPKVWNRHRDPPKKICGITKEAQKSFKTHSRIFSLQPSVFKNALYVVSKRGYTVSSVLPQFSLPMAHEPVFPHQRKDILCLSLTTTVVSRLFASFNTFQERRIFPRVILLILKRVFEDRAAHLVVAKFLRQLFLRNN